MRRSFAFIAGLMLVSACREVEGEPKTPVVTASESAIVGGSSDTGDDNVFQLFMQGNNGIGAGCTATLIGTRTLLSAGHCLDVTMMEGATSMTVYASNKYSTNQITQGDLYQVVTLRLHPQWNPTQDLSNDISLGLLDRAVPGVTPKPWNRANIDGFAGRSIRAVGFGTTGASGNGSGLRRTVGLTFRDIWQGIFFLGDQAGKGICHGDSGGPTFYTFGDGVERVVGVHSFTQTQECTDGADTRVDAYASFIDEWMSQYEAPTCARDGRCKAGCTPVDFDCACANDGQCTAECPDLAQDPDCPANCAADSICSVGVCPVPDRDCANLGQPCLGPNQCQTRLCVSDAQHSSPYCSAHCGAGCAAAMECDVGRDVCQMKQLPAVRFGEHCTGGVNVCVGGSVCTGPLSDVTYCQKPCIQVADCGAAQRCNTGFDGTRYCQDLPPIVLPAANSLEGEAAASCSSVGWAAMPWAWVLVLRRRRRARA